jgi:predicted secreted protein
VKLIHLACLLALSSILDDMTVESIAVAVGQEFTVSLKSTPTTGYVWEVQKLPPDVVLSGSDYETPKGAIKPGSPVTQVFRLKVQKPGEYEITFVLKRSWENKAIETHKVTVKAS